jgi:hypothetical protein
MTLLVVIGDARCLEDQNQTLLSDKVYPQNELQKYIVTSKLSTLSVSVRTVFLFSGGQIWCEIISELKVGTELLSSFTIQEHKK